ncbi:hypothetical protein FA95DRAFT_1612324 [Auriscalpium vulgare]|uniref:Uncharacterized protein n=2 Tax=Auriscalpium vulgare TaxID=40419 RepID=A0ACB8R2Q6_9AGAM|nr:hypothetical protein FA95DRAFT_1613425 [Auriscalpium vulgare]KAI0039762.1 hypothetical protein FA95DRAFT_1612324 [Auriscalpium vulgare]
MLAQSGLTRSPLLPNSHPMLPPTAAPNAGSPTDSSVQDKPQSYYERNKVQRRDYQRRYAADRHSMGRRKMSKKNIELKRRKLREERTCPSVYTNVLPYSNRVYDPERTTLMAMDEAEVQQSCKELRSAARDSGECESAGEWWLKYAEDVRHLLDEHLVQARKDIASPKDVPLAQYRLLHTHRRIIAGLHQEIELYSQDLEAVHQARETTGFIFDGARVKKRVFRKIYGF